jgi:hypothetical protein
MWVLFHICTSLSIIHHINRNNNKNHLIISSDEEKAFDKIQHNFMIKALMNVGIERMYCNTTKAIFEKLTANIIHNVEKLKPFPLGRPRKGANTLHSFQRSLGIPSQTNKAGRRNKRNRNG